MTDDRHHWDEQPGDQRRIAQHLLRQRGLADNLVQLDDGRIVLVGADAEGEGDDDCQR